MQGSLSVTHVTNYKSKTEYVYFSSPTCTRKQLRAPIFQIFLGGHPPDPLLLHTQKSHPFFYFPPLLQNPVSIPVTCDVNHSLFLSSMVDSESERVKELETQIEVCIHVCTCTMSCIIMFMYVYFHVL